MSSDLSLHDIAQDIFMSGIRAADPYERILSTIVATPDSIEIAGYSYPRAEYTRVIVIGAGKASARMAEATEYILGDMIESGWINTKKGQAIPLNYIHVHEAGHPVPDSEGVYGTTKIIQLLQDADEHTLVIGLLSGGGSALLPSPVQGITLEQKQDITRILLKVGASIQEINTIRKHVSALKGGGMARLAAPAKLHMLILSDVIGNRLDTIASGPATADKTTYQDCIEILDKYHIESSIPESILRRIISGAEGKIPETAKEDDDFLEYATNTIICDNHIAAETSQARAKKHGFNTLLLTTSLNGEAKFAGTMFASIASEIQQYGNPISKPACIIAGGETTVTVNGNGRGGRNQEMALQVAKEIDGMQDTVFLSGGTDGTDGPTDAAGGCIDGDTVTTGNGQGMSIEHYLNDNDSYHYLQKVSGLIKTGPTGTNVMDLQVLLIGKPLS